MNTFLSKLKQIGNKVFIGRNSRTSGVDELLPIGQRKNNAPGLRKKTGGR
jgi:hypothetical protein